VFSNIVERAQQLQKPTAPTETYGNSRSRRHNDITSIFPSSCKEMSLGYVLNRLQPTPRQGSNLAWTAGGTSFLVELETSKLSTNTQRRGRAGQRGGSAPRSGWIVSGCGAAPAALPMRTASSSQLPRSLRSRQGRSHPHAANAPRFWSSAWFHGERRMLAKSLIEPGYEVLREDAKEETGPGSHSYLGSSVGRSAV